MTLTPDNPPIDPNRPILPKWLRDALDDYIREGEKYGQGVETNLLDTRAILETRICEVLLTSEEAQWLPTKVFQLSWTKADAKRWAGVNAKLRRIAASLSLSSDKTK